MKKFPFIYNRNPTEETLSRTRCLLGALPADGTEEEKGQTEQQTHANKLVMLGIKDKIPIVLILRGLKCIHVFINHILEDLLCSMAASNIEWDLSFK